MAIPQIRSVEPFWITRCDCVLMPSRFMNLPRDPDLLLLPLASTDTVVVPDIEALVLREDVCAG